MSRLGFNIGSSALRGPIYKANNTVPRAFSTCSAVNSKGPWSDPITKPLNRYVVIAEDYSDPGALARRLEVRDRHLEQAAQGKETGRIEVGGALLKRDFKDIDEELGPASVLTGSLFIIQGESAEEVRARLDQDEYVRAGVFDPSKIRIFPFLRAMNERSSEIGHKTVGDTMPVSTRKPQGQSSVKTSFAHRSEVYVTDPKASGKTLNAGDRRSSENTLGQLRNTQSRQKKTITLGTLRRHSPSTHHSEESQ